MSYLIEEYIRQMPFIIERGDIEDDAFTDCLLIQKCIKNLNKSELFSDTEKDILIAMIEGYNYAEMGRILQLDRQTISSIAKSVTDRIAYVLGGEFTDDGLMDRLPNRPYKKRITKMREDNA